MRYVQSKIKKQIEERAYRIYVTDSLKFISENTMRFAGGHAIEKRFIDIVKPQPEKVVSSEETIDKIRNKLKELG